jgi:hypothetical protein
MAAKTATNTAQGNSMSQWSISTISSLVADFSTFTPSQQQRILLFMNEKYPPALTEEQLKKRSAALSQMNRYRTLLEHATQQFPECIHIDSIRENIATLRGFAVVFTAGGEGERLKNSLLAQGVSSDALTDFTKATYPLPGFFGEFSTLAINLVMLSALNKNYDYAIPVVITTGPEGSTTAEVIPRLMERYDNFGLEHLRVVPQEERLFFTSDEKIVMQREEIDLQPVTHPDETGGPLMRLKKKDTSGRCILDWFASLGCDKTLVVQGIALYHRTLLPKMAGALGSHDCLGVGIRRNAFPPEDPYGTFVTLSEGETKTTIIIEQDVRNDTTRMVKDDTGTYHLPFNTGFYAFQNSLLDNNDLPDFATPPKELRPDLSRAPKIGYAATDMITLAKNPVILTIESGMFRVLKNADDLERLSALGKEFGLDELCREFVRERTKNED